MTREEPQAGPFGGWFGVTGLSEVYVTGGRASMEGWRRVSDPTGRFPPATWFCTPGRPRGNFTPAGREVGGGGSRWFIGIVPCLLDWTPAPRSRAAVAPRPSPAPAQCGTNLSGLGSGRDGAPVGLQPNTWCGTVTVVGWLMLANNGDVGVLLRSVRVWWWLVALALIGACSSGTPNSVGGAHRGPVCDPRLMPPAVAPTDGTIAGMRQQLAAACHDPASDSCATHCDAYRAALLAIDPQLGDLFQRCRTACDSGRWQACGSVGMTLSAAQPPSLATADTYYQRGCDAGHAGACYLWAARRLVEHRDGEAVQLLRRGCSMSDCPSCMRLAQALHRGEGVPLACDQSVHLMLAVCDSGLPEACGWAGLWYRDGDACAAADPVRARRLLDHACNGGSTYFCSKR